MELVLTTANLQVVELRRIGDAWELTEAVQLTSAVVWDSLVGSVPALRADLLRLTFLDQDGDGRADRLFAKGSGTHERHADDYTSERAVNLAFEGVPDRKRPELEAGAAPLRTAAWIDSIEFR